MFIRTKDDVYDTEKLIYRRIEGNKLYRVGWDVEKPTFEADIINQSDNLAELCDCLMIVDEDGDFFITQVYKINIPYYIKDKKCFGCIKIELPNGAIRIEPVAKMNEKGELVLI